MSTIDRSVIEKTARLANLSLSETELDAYAGQMSEILSYVEQINELNTADVQPTDHILEIFNVTRADQPGTSLGREAIEKVAPVFENGHFVVPRIIES